jgi:hypothetical protein
MQQNQRLPKTHAAEVALGKTAPGEAQSSLADQPVKLAQWRRNLHLSLAGDPYRPRCDGGKDNHRQQEDDDGPQGDAFDHQHARSWLSIRTPGRSAMWQPNCRRSRVVVRMARPASASEPKKMLHRPSSSRPAEVRPGQLPAAAVRSARGPIAVRSTRGPTELRHRLLLRRGQTLARLSA